MNKIALFDIDNTMYDGFSYFALLEKQVGEGLIAKSILESALQSMQRYKSKQQDYESTIVELLDIYATGLKGKSYAAVLRSSEEFYNNSDKFFSYLESTIPKLKATHDVSLVTGEPQFVAEAVGSRFGIKTYYSTMYEVADGLFTGKVTSYLASRHEKHAAIKHLMRDHGARHSFAFGDSEGDIEMLRAVEFPICLNATEGLRKIAEKEKWHMPDIREVSSLVDSLVQGADDLHTFDIK